MSPFQKFLVYVFSGMAVSALFIYEVYGQESIGPAYKIGSNTILFDNLGAHHDGINPCLDLENDTLRWCTVHAAKQALKEIPLDSIDRDFLEAALTTKFPCQTISIYIGEICKQENFLKIFRHFTNRNEPCLPINCTSETREYFGNIITDTQCHHN